MTVSLPSPPNILADGKRTVRFVERDGVIAVLAERLDQAGVGDRGCPALDGYGARVDENASGRVAAGRDRVVEIVAGRRQRAVTGVEGARNSHCHNPFKTGPRHGCASAVNRI